MLLGGRWSAIGDLQSAIAAPWAFFGNIAIFMKMVILAKMEDNDNDRWPYRLWMAILAEMATLADMAIYGQNGHFGRHGRFGR